MEGFVRLVKCCRYARKLSDVIQLEDGAVSPDPAGHPYRFHPLEGT